MTTMGQTQEGSDAMALPAGKHRKVMRQSTREALYGYAMLSPWLIGFLVFVLFPMAASLVIGMFRTDFLTTWEFVGLHYYKSVVSDLLVRKALINTAYFSLVSVPLSTMLALSIAGGGAAVEMAV